MWSRIPCQSLLDNNGSLARPRQLCFRVHKQAARFPLSTVEMNRGSKGREVSISYQLKKWPLWRGNCSALPSVRSTVSAYSSKVKKPNSSPIRR
jgi:hypothetical protein